MQIDDLKKTWKAYDHKIQTSKAITDNLIASVITQRSQTRIDTIKQKLLAGLGWLLFWIVLAIVIVVTNPFDYAYMWQFTPIIIFSVCVLILFIGLMRSLLALIRTPISRDNLQVALAKIVYLYEKPRQFFNYTVMVLITSSGLLFPMSFLPKMIERVGLWPALLERMIPIAIFTSLMAGAFKMGWFRDKNGEKFKADLAEFEEYQAMSMELRAE